MNLALDEALRRASAHFCVHAVIREDILVRLGRAWREVLRDCEGVGACKLWERLGVMFDVEEGMVDVLLDCGAGQMRRRREAPDVS